MRTYTRILVAASLFLMMAVTTQNAQVISVLRPPIGSTSTCPAGWDNVLTANGNVFRFPATGTATFSTTAVSAANQPAGNRQSLQTLTASAVVEQLGTISWTAVNSLNTTQIVANQLNTDFPATSDIYFKPTATVSSKPGVTYTGSEVHLRTTSLGSFNPQVGESYTLVNGPILFQGNDGSSFTLDLRNFVVN
jgi:hypothetical protein